jgi:hypothetical protein
MSGWYWCSRMRLLWTCATSVASRPGRTGTETTVGSACGVAKGHPTRPRLGNRHNQTRYVRTRWVELDTLASDRLTGRPDADLQIADYLVDRVAIRSGTDDEDGDTRAPTERSAQVGDAEPGWRVSLQGHRDSRRNDR